MKPTEMSSQPVLWNRNFIQCCISYFLMSFAFYMLMPTMPLYLTEELGISPGSVGLALSSYTAGLLCIRPFSGFLVDSFSRKHLYLFAFIMYGLLFTGYLIGHSLYSVILIRFIQGGFMGLTSVAGNTITIDVIPSRRRGEGMGFYGVTLNLSMSLAPILALFLYQESGFNYLILSTILVSLLGIGSVLLIKAPPKQKVKRIPFSLDRFILVKALPSALSYFLCTIPYGMIVSFVVLYGKEIGIKNPAHFFLLMATGVAASRVMSGKLIDRGKLHKVTISSLLSLILSFFIFAFVHTETTYYLSALFIGTGFGISIPAYQYLFINVASSQLRGTATSTYLTAFDLGVGSGTLLAGYIAAQSGLSWAFFTGGIFCIFSLVVYLFLSIPQYEKYKLSIK